MLNHCIDLHMKRINVLTDTLKFEYLSKDRNFSTGFFQWLEARRQIFPITLENLWRGGGVAFHSSTKREAHMATNPIGKGTKTIGVNMSKKMAEDLKKRASSMHISKSKYCKIILQQWLDSGKKLTLSE
jgi:hypothetical protein